MSEGAVDVPAAPATPSAPTAAATATTPNNAASSGADSDVKADTSAGVVVVPGTSTASIDAQTGNLAVAVPTTPSSTPQKERHSLTLDQRRALRRWANTQASRPSHKQCIEWFHRQYHQTISQSTVSHSLSPKYARLDGEPQLSGSRLRFGNWPEVEKLVLLWYQQMTNAGRHPTNEELADKAKNIFTQLPRHRGEEPPEFSPGWIHRFKKRYGLLIRRQRRQSVLGESSGSAVGDPATDIVYLVDAVPGIMNVAPDTSPVLIRDNVQRMLGIEPTIAVCARVRDEIIRYGGGSSDPGQGAHDNAAIAAAATGGAGLVGAGPPGLASATTSSEASAANAAAAAVAAAAAAAVVATAGYPPSRSQSHDPQHPQHPSQHSQPMNSGGAGSHHSNGHGTSYPNPDDDPEMVLQNALRQLQQQEEVEAAEAAAAAQASSNAAAGDHRGGSSSAATPTKGSGDAVHGQTDQPARCPFCVNQRMLRTIKEAVEHMSTHVVV